MLELLFEAYTIPKVCFGIDGAFSWYANKEKVGDALVISSGQSSTHLLPIWDGKLQFYASKRFPLFSNRYDAVALVTDFELA